MVALARSGCGTQTSITDIGVNLTQNSSYSCGSLNISARNVNSHGRRSPDVKNLPKMGRISRTFCAALAACPTAHWASCWTAACVTYVATLLWYYCLLSALVLINNLLWEDISWSAMWVFEPEPCYYLYAVDPSADWQTILHGSL